jgi:hypothetical protein
MPISKRTLAVANRIGIAPEQVKDYYNGQSLRVAEMVEEVLNGLIVNIQAQSASGALTGYKAFKEIIGSDSLRMSRTGITITVDKWFIGVLASEHHRSQGLNVFDILDRGRKALPKKSYGEAPYPIWGGPSRVTGGGGGSRPTASAPTSSAAVRREPRFSIDQPEPPSSFRMGPIRAVAAKNLYDAAERVAKDRLAGIVDPKMWDVIRVGS